MRFGSIPILLLLSGAAVAGCGRNTTVAASSAAAVAPSASPAAALAAAPVQLAAADTLPTQVGQCVQTTVKDVTTRLENTPGSGSAIDYSNGGDQVSYDQVPGIDSSQPGDPIKLCLVSLPQNCPAGDDRGKIYAGTNLRTGQTWSEADSEHSCGGA